MVNLLVSMLVLILLMLLGIYFYRFLNRYFKFSTTFKNNRIIRIIIVVICIIFFVALLLFGKVYTYLFIISSFIADIIYFALKKILKDKKVSDYVKKIYKSGICILLIFFMFLGYGYYNAHNVVIKNYSIDTDKDIENGNIKIAMIADLHLGTNMDSSKLKDYLSEIQDQNPDMLVLVGDIFDENTKKTDMMRAMEELGNVKTKYGIYYVFGNHDNGHFSGNQEINKDMIRDGMKRNRINVLEDDRVLVDDNFYVIGRNDASEEQMSGRESTDDLTNDLDKSKFMLLLDHQPHQFKESEECGIDLELCGHTHAGQVWPLGLIGNIFKFNDMTYGHKKINNTDFIVTSGIAGWGSAIRTEGKCEMVIVDVKEK